VERPTHRIGKRPTIFDYGLTEACCLEGAGPTTRLLLVGIAQAGIGDGTLWDVGAGVGALTFDLLDRGVRRA
jgi:hypothetical protein